MLISVTRPCVGGYMSLTLAAAQYAIVISQPFHQGWLLGVFIVWGLL